MPGLKGRMIKSGLSKSTAAKMLNVPIGTLSKWNIPSPNPPVRYPMKVKKASVLMARQGMMVVDIARQLGVPEGTVSRWTVGINSRRKMYSGRYFLALADILNNGYYEPKRNDGSLFNALRHYVPGLEKVREGKSIVWKIGEYVKKKKGLSY